LKGLVKIRTRELFKEGYPVGYPPSGESSHIAVGRAVVRNCLKWHYNWQGGYLLVFLNKEVQNLKNSVDILVRMRKGVRPGEEHWRP